MAIADSIFRALGLIQPGDLVMYHGSITDRHGLYIAEPCTCPDCRFEDHLGANDPRYRLVDPFDETSLGLRCVRRQSITPARGGH